MKKLLAVAATVAALTILAPVAMAAAPSKAPSENGAAAGEQGKGMSTVSSSQEQAYEATYKSDKAQEEQLKAGGKSG